jgi:hypothetical protein
MAKRKGARQAKSAKKSAPRKAPKKKATRPAARKKAAAGKKTSPASARRAAVRKKAARARKAVLKPARKAVLKRVAAKKATRRAGSAKAVSSRPRARALAVKPKTAPGKGIRRAARPAKPAARKTVPAAERKLPSLNRSRRVVLDDDDIVSSPPSSLDMDRSASAARSGRKAFYDRLDDHPETSPVITAGDVDADWESAYSVGDEAPGGDNPTPDQDIVDDIGRAVGNEYQDNEPLKGADKIMQRDKHRWELDPGSKEDFDEED